jgi:outer membrane protein assembly factor BamB
MNRFAVTTRRCAPLLASALLLLAACDKDKFDPPAELTEFHSTAKVEHAWSAGVGGGKPALRLGLGLALDGDRVFAAGHNGDVVAYDVLTGRRLWQTDTKLDLTGGPGAGSGLVVAGASHGDLVALDAATGERKWKTHINSEILSAPAITADLVLLRTVDGRLSAFKSSDGTLLWSAEQQVPRLSLRGAAAPAVGGDLVVSGFDNGRVMAVQLRNGDTLWDVSVAPPSGKSELERLNDIDTQVKIVDDDIYAVTFQGKVARIDRDTGQMQWSRDMSSYSGLATDEDGLYVTSAQGSVVKIGRRTGVETWKQDVLKNRRLSPPVIVGSLVAVVDLQGYVHFLDAGSGQLAARIKSGGDRVTAAPVVSGNTVIVIDNDGHISALRVVTPGA